VIECITVVLRHAPEEWPSGTRLVALALADHVNADAEAWPTIQRLAWMTNLDRRTVQRHLRRIEHDGYIETVGQRYDPQGFARATVYKWRMWITKVGAAPMPPQG